jgi:UDP-glucose 4-epimerase
MDEETCIEVSKGVDCIVHLAANTGVPQSVMDPRKDLDTNVIGTFNLLNAARINNVKQFVFASSGAPAGEVEPPIHEEIAPHPVSPYGASKLAGEGYCSAYANSFGINTIILRFSNVYGPLSTHKTSVVAKFIKNAINGIPCEIYGDGSQTRDFIYIDDLVNAILKASIFEKGGEIFQIATGKEITVFKLAEELKNIFQNLGYKMDVTFGDIQIGDVLRNYSDTTKANHILDWRNETQLKQGLENTIKYFLQNLSI